MTDFVTPAAALQLEQMIDRHGLANVLEQIADICGAKAEHLRTNWQDTNAARYWDKAARAVLRCAGDARIKVLS